MSESDNTITQNYYANKNISEFYNKIWGGENIHIGMYNNLNENIKVTPEMIKQASNNKIDFMLTYINKFIKNKNSKIKLADFGSGFGGTARYIHDKFVNEDIKFEIDCYELSKENCDIFLQKNKNYTNINIYNTSFLETGKPDNYYDIIISEDAFIHINNKDEIFQETSRVLNINGMFIFSDIILTEKNTHIDINEVYKRININSIGSNKIYLNLGNKYNLEYKEGIEYQSNMLKHYENIKYLSNGMLENTEDKNRIISGVDSWIKHIKLNNITTKLFIFTT